MLELLSFIVEIGILSEKRQLYRFLHVNVEGSEAATFSRACVYNYSLVNYRYVVWKVGFLNKDFVERHHYLL